MRGRRDWKSWIVLFAAVTVAGILIGVNAGPLEPPGPPGDPTMKPIDQVYPRTAIYASMMPFTIDEPGSYYLAENITTTGPGIFVNVDDVIIDLMGYTLEGGTGPGIDCPYSERATVRNGTIRNWSGTGVLLASEAVVSDLQVRDNGGSGITVGTHSRVVDCTVLYNNVHGIVVWNASIVDRCIVGGNTENGIFVEGEFGSLVSGCVVDLSGKNGIRVDGYSRIVNNKIRKSDPDGHNGKAGIWVLGIYNHIEGNTLVNNNIGIDLDGSYNTITRNVVGYSLGADFDEDPSAIGNLMPVFTMGSAGTPAPWDNIDQY